MVSSPMAADESDDTDSVDPAGSPESPGAARKGASPDEVYCTSCGDPIKKEAEICPECGVRQSRDSTSGEPESNVTDSPQSTLSDRRQYELEKIASKNVTTVMLWGLLLTPVAYLKVGKTGLALLNFLTLNYGLTGFIVVPLHTRKMIKDAREELRKAGVAGY